MMYLDPRLQFHAPWHRNLIARCIFSLTCCCSNVMSDETVYDVKSCLEEGTLWFLSQLLVPRHGSK